jgi:hypothetical protein
VALSTNNENQVKTNQKQLFMDQQLVSFITCGCELNTPTFAIYKAGRFLFYQSKTVVHLNNQNLDIKCSAHDAFLE